MKSTIFNLSTCDEIVNQLRSLLTGTHYQFDTEDSARIEQLDPDGSKSGDALNLTKYEDWALLTVCDTYGVWQISECDRVSISNGVITIQKMSTPTRRTWTITPLNQIPIGYMAFIGDKMPDYDICTNLEDENGVNWRIKQRLWISPDITQINPFEIEGWTHVLEVAPQNEYWTSKIVIPQWTGQYGK
jgi:hypothetical protein